MKFWPTKQKEPRTVEQFKAALKELKPGGILFYGSDEEFNFSCALLELKCDGIIANQEYRKKMRGGYDVMGLP